MEMLETKTLGVSSFGSSKILVLGVLKAFLPFARGKVEF